MASSLPHHPPAPGVDQLFLDRYHMNIPRVGAADEAIVRNESQILPIEFQPSAKDILLGRGKAFNNHVGNRRFRVAVAMNLRAYVESPTKTQKGLCVQRILQAIRTASPTGGFVKKDSKTGSWMTVTDTEACQKIGHALRDAWSGASSNTKGIISDSPIPKQEAESFEARIQRAQYLCVVNAVRNVAKAAQKKLEPEGPKASSCPLRRGAVSVQLQQKGARRNLPTLSTRPVIKHPPPNFPTATQQMLPPQPKRPYTPRPATRRSPPDRARDGTTTRRPSSFKPSDFDVICGRDRSVLSHPGNQRFRALIAVNLKPYVGARNKLEKSMIVNTIYDQLSSVSAHGGFIKRDSKTGEWVLLDDVDARAKIAHSLRDSYNSVQVTDDREARLLKAQQALFGSLDQSPIDREHYLSEESSSEGEQGRTLVAEEFLGIPALVRQFPFECLERPNPPASDGPGIDTRCTRKLDVLAAAASCLSSIVENVDSQRDVDSFETISEGSDKTPQEIDEDSDSQSGSSTESERSLLAGTKSYLREPAKHSRSSKRSRTASPESSSKRARVADKAHQGRPEEAQVLTNMVEVATSIAVIPRRLSAESFGIQSISDSEDTAGRSRCTPRVKMAFPSILNSTANGAAVPAFDELTNYPANGDHATSSKRRCCVMCGQKRLFGVGVGNIDAVPVIPRQNKGICTDCDIKVWIVRDNNREIKWCKGCNNFRAWDAFGVNRAGRKCTLCCDRWRERYQSQKV